MKCSTEHSLVVVALLLLVMHAVCFADGASEDTFGGGLWTSPDLGNAPFFSMMESSSGFLVNDDTTGRDNRQVYPAAAGRPSGEAVVVWVDERSTWRRLYARRLGRDGTPLGDYFGVDDVASVEDPAIAVSSSGRFVIVWEGYGDDIAGEIHFQTYDSSGNKAGTNMKVPRVTSSSQSDPDVALADMGRFVITWSENSDIYCQLYDSLGISLGTTHMVNDTTDNRQAWPAVAMDESGSFVITWEDERRGSSDWDVYAQRFDSAGDAIGSNFRVNDDDSTAIQWSPNIAIDPLGSSVIIWYDLGIDGGLRARLYDSLGYPTGSSFKVNDDTVGIGNFYVAPPEVAKSSSGTFVVTWPTNSIFQRLMAQRFDKTGTRLGPNIAVSEKLFSIEESASAVCDSAGDFAVCWAYQGQLDKDIMIRYFDVDGNPKGTETLVADDAGCSDQRNPSVASNEVGGFVAIWVDNRDGQGYCYFQQFDNNGNKLYENAKSAGTRSDFSPTALIEPDGKTLVVWLHHADLYAQWYTGFGDSVETRFRVNDTTISTTYAGWYPTVAKSLQGNFVVAWTDHRHGSFTSSIYAQLYDSSSAPTGSNFLVSGIGGPGDVDAAVATADVNGDFIVVWDEGINVYLRRYSNLGDPIGGIEMLNRDEASHPSVSADANGNVVATWAEATENGTDIFMQMFDGQNQPLNSKIRVNDDGGSGWQGYPDVAVTPLGEIMIVWLDSRLSITSQDYYDIYGQVFSVGGDPRGSNFLITDSAYVEYGQMWPDVAASGDNVLVTWQDNRREKGWDVYARVVNLMPTGVEEDESGAVYTYGLSQNYPNPFNPNTVISYTLPSGSDVKLTIHNILGQTVATLVDETQPAGRYEVVWSGKTERGTQAATGVYLYRLEAGSHTAVKKMLLLR